MTVAELLDFLADAAPSNNLSLEIQIDHGDWLSSQPVAQFIIDSTGNRKVVLK